MGAQVDPEKSKTFSNAVLIALSSALGWGFELFDYTAFIFAATLFAPYFFPAADAATSLIYAIATASLTFFSRPLGGFLFGHYGDRLGRKSVWFIALLGMGVVSFAMGFLPTYQQVGIIATIALVSLRILQGIFINGEQAGGWVLTTEVAPSKWRGFFGGVVGMGAGLSQVFLSLSIFLASALAPGSQFAVMGWRIIFWVGILPLLVALFVRWKATESIEWRAKAAPKVEKIPLLAALRLNLRFFIVILLAYAGQTLFVFGSITFLPTFLKLYTTVTPASIATIVLVSNVAVMIGAPLWGMISDNRRRRRSYLTVAFLINAAILYPLMLVMSQGQVVPSLIAGVVLGFLNPLALSVMPAWIAENTKTSMRYSVLGTGNGFGVAIGGLAPYLVVMFSPGLGPAIATAAVAITGCLLAAFIIPFSPPDRAKQELE
jgi:MHS family shikimate/dehydroshikimate transporter-like MFS transporter